MQANELSDKRKGHDDKHEPSPNRYPSANRVDVLWKTHALSTSFRKRLTLSPVDEMFRSLARKGRKR